MTKACKICGKTVSFGHNVSHAKNRTRRVFKPNLKKMKVEGLPAGRQGKKIVICKKCLKRLKLENLKRKTEKPKSSAKNS